MSQITRKTRDKPEDGTAFDRRDRLILALYAELKAERETRAALEAAIRNGALSNELLLAMVSDPVPVITSEDIAEVERFVSAGSAPAKALERTRTGEHAGRPPR